MELWAAGVILLSLLAGILALILCRKKLHLGVWITGACVLGMLFMAVLGYIALTFLFLGAIDSSLPEEPAFSMPVETEEQDIIEESKLAEESETPAPLAEDYDLPVSEVPEFLPDVLSVRNLQYEQTRVFSTINETAAYALWNFLNNRLEFECYLTRELAPDDGKGHQVLHKACQCALSYYLFSAYTEWDMYTVDRGDEEGVYAKVKLIYDNPDYDLEARAEAMEFVLKNPVPEGGFADRQSEMEYARKIHDYIACKVTYSPIGYDPESMSGMRKYEAYQEAYNVLAEEQNTAVCAGYARGFALIAQYAGINCAWVWGNETDTESHAWNVIYPCDGSEPVLVDVTWDDGMSDDVPGQSEVSDLYFYCPLSTEDEHTADADFESFLNYINELCP